MDIMRTYRRGLEHFIVEALQQKMVFLGGLRQVGKTTFALYLLEMFKKKRDSKSSRVNERHSAYLNWDDPRVPPQMRSMQLPLNEPFLRSYCCFAVYSILQRP